MSNNNFQDVEMVRLPPLSALSAAGGARDPPSGHAAGEDFELALLTSRPSPASTFNISDAPGGGESEEGLGRHVSDATAPLLRSSPANPDGAEGSDGADASVKYLQRVAELCEKILESNLRRERRFVSDSENAIIDASEVPKHEERVGSLKGFEDPLSLGEVKPWKYEKVPMMTQEEMKADPSWEDRASTMLSDTKYAAHLKRWKGGSFVNSDECSWLLPRLGLLSITFTGAERLDQLTDHYASRNYALLICHRLDWSLALRRIDTDAPIIPARLIIIIITLTCRAGVPLLEDYTVGDILIECYRRGLLRQPMYDHMNKHIEHFYLVIESLFILAIAYH